MPPPHIRNQVASLNVMVRVLIRKLTDAKPGFFSVEPEKLSRQWLRKRIIDSMVTSTLWHAPDSRTIEELLRDYSARYGSSVDAFIEKNLELIAEIRMAVSA